MILDHLVVMAHVFGMDTGVLKCRGMTQVDELDVDDMPGKRRGLPGGTR